MTPKEKAIEIYTKMYNEVYASYGTDFLAKQCALIAVNEMIIQNGELFLNGLNGDYYRKKNAFLFEVKQELEKL
jgi:hypothetical protein